MALRAVTLDVYSALVDTVGGLQAALVDVLAGRGQGQRARELAGRWRRYHRDYLLVAAALDGEPASNRRALTVSLRRALGDLQPPLRGDEEDALLAAWERLPPWPETVDVLRALRARPLRLGVLSNGDRGALAALLRTLPVAVDVIVSTEGGRFKPHRWVYEQAVALMGVSRDELLHVAGSPTDAVGATAAGIRAVWVNREGEAVCDPRYAPAWEVSDLRGILPVVDGLLAGLDSPGGL
ncbi:MAG: HAD-IA family hydrolase [Armatimonadota bacterium]|nr:HAD-IA family hydrolase [Armatimonadota bacterium]